MLLFTELLLVESSRKCIQTIQKCPEEYSYPTASSLSRNFHLHSGTQIKGTDVPSLISNKQRKSTRFSLIQNLHNKMSSSISSFSMCNVPISSSLKGNGGSNSSLPISIKTPAKPKLVGVMASNGRDNLDHLQRVNPQTRKRTTQPQGANPAPVVVWDYRTPAARTVQQMMDTMERLMEDPVAYAEDNGYPRRRRRTPWDIKESQTSYKIRYDMPGMTRNDVKVWVEDKMLVLEAQKKQQVEEEDAWPPESYGKYSNRIALPETVDLEKIKAEVKDGVLYITIPKARETTKKIEISVN